MCIGLDTRASLLFIQREKDPLNKPLWISKDEFGSEIGHSKCIEVYSGIFEGLEVRFSTKGKNFCHIWHTTIANCILTSTTAPHLKSSRNFSANWCSQYPALKFTVRWTIFWSTFQCGPISIHSKHHWRSAQYVCGSFYET